MPEDISLLPREVEKKREQEVRGQLLRKVSLVFLVASLLLGAGIFVYSVVLQTQSSNLKKNIREEKSKIGSLADIELKVQDLEKRTKVLGEVFASKAYFSGLLTTLSRAVPADVSISEMTVPSEETITVSGTSRSYASLAKFLLNLKEAEIFTVVELRSVSLDQQTGEANFDVSLQLTEGGLRQ